MKRITTLLKAFTIYAAIVAVSLPASLVYAAEEAADDGQTAEDYMSLQDVLYNTPFRQSCSDGSLSVAGTDGGAALKYKNPIIDHESPDPSIIRGEDGKYYMYASGFQQFVSSNMVKWEKINDGIKWIKGVPAKARDYWAPDIAKVGNLYVLTMSLNWDGLRRVGYATSKSAKGPFQYRGELINAKDRGVSGWGYDIDPQILETDKGIYLYYGSGRKYLKAVKLELNADGTDFTEKRQRSKVIFTTEHNIGPIPAEGSYVFKRGNYYYLFFSAGDWLNTARGTPYQLHVARSKSPTGPFEEKMKPILTGNDDFTHTGHNSVIRDAEGNDWIYYHAYPKGKSVRHTMLDRITWKDNWPTINDGHPSAGGDRTPLPGESPAVEPTNPGISCVCKTPGAASLGTTVGKVDKDFSLGADRGKRPVNLLKTLMTDFNFEDFQAAGIVGNFMHESGGEHLPPDVNEGGAAGPPKFSGGYGWAQWTGGRQVGMIDFAVAKGYMKSKKVHATDAANYAWLVHELTETAEKKAVPAVKATKDVSAAAAKFEEVFERAGVVANESRDEKARKVLNAYKNGTSVTDESGEDSSADCPADSTVGVEKSANFGHVVFPLKVKKSDINANELNTCTDPPTEGCHNYMAYDISTNTMPEVVAFAAGTVTYTSVDRCGGKYLSIWNEEAKLAVTYMHLSSHIGKDKKVKPGDHVGTIGNAAAGCGSEHLHIDASTDKVRQACSRRACSIQDHFRDISKDLKATYERLPE